MDNRKIAKIMNMDPRSDDNALLEGLKKMIDRTTVAQENHDRMTKEVKELENELKELTTKKVTNMIDTAVKDKRISEDMRNDYTEMATENPERTEKIIKHLPKIKR